MTVFLFPCGAGASIYCHHGGTFYFRSGNVRVRHGDMAEKKIPNWRRLDIRGDCRRLCACVVFDGVLRNYV
jgi:hypothetical protein